MAFFTSPEQEVFEHRLKRSPSLTSVRTRSRQPSGAPKSPTPSRTHTHSRLLPASTSGDVSAPRPPSPIPSPIPSPVPATSPNLNGPDYDLKSSPKLSRGSVPQQVSSGLRDDSRSLRVPSVHEPVQRRQHLDTSSSPSSLPLDSRRDFDTGSLSDSGVNSRRPRSPRRSNLSAPSPHNVHLSPPMARHHSPSSPNLPIAGYFSDGERSPNFLHPSRLDVKRLLSKPAAPSVNSTLSITSDSESNAAPRAQPNSEAWPSKATRMQVHFQSGSQPNSQPSSTPPTESTELLPTSPPPVVQPRQRNLLRKRSASKQTRASVSATLPGKATTSSALQPATRSSAVASSRISAPPHGSSSKLTPASAIAQAYKEQDLRREALAAAARAENLSTIVPASGSRISPPDTPTSAASAASTVGKGKSYYTVLETSPDRIVLVGSVEDNSYDAVDAPSSGSHSAPASASVGQPIRSLTRKVSARFRRGRPVVTRDSSTQSVHGDGGDGEFPLSGDPLSRHERLQSASYPKVKGKDSLRLSLDQRNVAVPSGESSDGHDHRPVPSESMPDVVGSSPPQSKGKHKPQEDDTGAGGRLWRLVKRISAGGLRERFYTTGAPAPPVPAIPPDLVPSRATLEVKKPVTPNRTNGSGGAEPGGGGDHERPTVGRFKDPHPSTSAVRPNADDRSDMTCTTLTGVPATPQDPGTISQPRHPSISSSSPQSSEPTSTHFFRSHSSRSSFSSIFCGSPPLPPVSALAQSPVQRTRSRAKSSSSSPALPPSNDESPQTSSVRTRKRSSPDMPTFSVSAVVNNFIVRRPSVTRRQPQNASARSTTPHSEETSAPPPRSARSDLCNAAGREERVHPLLSPGLSVQSRDSHSSSSTERAGSASTSTISAHAVAGTSARTGSVTRMTFRELGGTRRQAWTSQEKEDKWDDLLEKSAQAGGTLHLDTESVGLPSDNIRFSSGTLESEVLSS